MRIAVFSNLYPPLYIGGYEIGASRIVHELGRRGHHVMVLSAHEYTLQRQRRFLHHRHSPERRSTLIDAGPCLLGSAGRLLASSPFALIRHLAAVAPARHRYREALQSFRPQRLLLFNPLGVLAPVLADWADFGRAKGIPTHAYLSDPWLAEWPRAHPVLRLLQRLEDWGVRLIGVLRSCLGTLARPLPRLDGYFCCSRYIRRHSGLGPEQPVVPWGLPGVESWPTVPPSRFFTPDPLTLVYSGQITEQKGLAVLLHALAQCRRAHRLVVIGDDRTEDAGACKQLARRLGIASRICFHGQRPPEELPALLARSGQVLVAPALWDEPFSLTVLEGMAAAMAVVASATGGTAEAIVDGQTGLLFPRGQVRALAEGLDRLEEDRLLGQRLARQARETVRQRFTLERMVEQILA